MTGKITSGSIWPQLEPMERQAEREARSFTSLEMSESNEPYGTFKKLLIENIDITVGQGAVQPSYVIRAEQGSVFGDISMSGIRIFSES